MIRTLLDFVHGLATRVPYVVLGVFVGLAAAGAWAFVERLEIVSSRGALTDPSADFNALRDAYDEEFGSANEPVVLVVRPDVRGTPLRDPTPRERTAMKRVAERWAAALRGRPDLFADVTERFDPEAIEPWSLLYASEQALGTALDRIDAALPRVARLAAASTLGEALAVGRDLVDSLPSRSSDEGAGDPGALLAIAEAAFSAFREEVEGPSATGPTPDTVRPSTGADPGDAPVATLLAGEDDRDGFLFSADGRLLVAQALVLGDPTVRDRYAEPMAVAASALERAAAEVRDAFPDAVVDAGLAGEPALELEEAEITRRDFTRSAVVAAVIVSLLFMWGFGSVLRPALATACLGLSVAATFLVAWIAIGHLNVLAMVFTVILVALGIDFAIHFYVHYRQAVSAGLGPRAAIGRTYAEVGSALWTDGLATAAAFWVAWFTDFPGLAELGVIAGAGLLICLAAMYFAFPALLYLVDTRWPGPTSTPSVLRLMRMSEPGTGWAARATAVVVLLAAAGGALFGEYDFDTNLLALQPSDGVASGWQRLLLDVDDRSQFVLATYPNEGELSAAQERLASLPEVRRVESVLPVGEEETRRRLEPLCSTVAGLFVDLDRDPDVTEVRRGLFGLRQTLRRYAASGAEARETLAGLTEDVDAVYRTLSALPPDDAEARLADVQRQLRREIEDGRARLETLLCPPPVDASTAPPLLRDRFVGGDGSLALRVYPAVNTWEDGPRRAFLSAVRGVEPRVFGGVVGFHENTRAMVRSFAQAAVYSLGMIGVLVLLWTRSVRRAALAALPLWTGLPLLLGAMESLDLTWNLGNFFAGPILIGVGVAGGVHLVRGWEIGEDAFRASLGAVTLSSLTTMIGFGLLALGQHRGVASLGLILFLGIGFNLFACLTILPVALRFLEPGGGAKRRVDGASSSGGFGGPGDRGAAVEGASIGDGPEARRVGPAPGSPKTLLPVLCLLAVSATEAGLHAQDTGPPTLLFVKPGDPAATPEMAGEFIADLSAYLRERVPRLGADAVEGVIVNDASRAAAVLRERTVSVAFVPPAFYLSHVAGGAAAATPVAQLPRFGSERARWYLVGPADSSGGVEALEGRRVHAPPGIDERFVSRVAFRGRLVAGRGFTLAVSENLSDDVFFMLEGDPDAPAALLLDEELKHFFESDDFVWPGLRIMNASEPVPWDLVVAVGPWQEDELDALRAALSGMGGDDEGRRLLELMDSRGFEPVDTALLGAAEERYNEGGAGPGRAPGSG